MIKDTLKLIYYIGVALLPNSVFFQQHSGFFRNIDSRGKIMLNRTCNIIIDTLGISYYFYLHIPVDNGDFKNAKVPSPSELLRHKFDTSYHFKLSDDWEHTNVKYFLPIQCLVKKAFDTEKIKNTKTYQYFETVNYDTRVSLKAKIIAPHVGGYIPLQFQVTEKLNSVGNIVLVKIDNTQLFNAIFYMQNEDDALKGKKFYDAITRRGGSRNIGYVRTLSMKVHQVPYISYPLYLRMSMSC